MSTCSLVHSIVMSHALGKVGKPGARNGTRLYGKDLFVWLPTDTASTDCIGVSHSL